MTDDEKQSVIMGTIDAYLAEVDTDAEELDSDDLAWAIVHALRVADKSKGV
ncbi:hypothetical protein AB0F11_14280 [Streptomyces sp. NPDC032472]|uniref:hypothetical protein n=1 Tax=Streptomyces sp. NPDC032472 TaxID=3155018 RepID=UPI003411D014